MSSTVFTISVHKRRKSRLLARSTTRRRRLLIEQLELRNLLAAASDDEYWIQAGSVLTIPNSPLYESSVLSNDSFASTETDQPYSVASQPNHGSIDANWGDSDESREAAMNDGLPFTYVPNSVGPDWFNYTLCDYVG